MTAPSQTSELAAPVETAAQLVPALRTAAAAGLVAFGLSFPIISYHAELNINNELVLTGRWPLSFGIAALVFAFVFLRQMARADWRIWFDRVGSVAAGGMGGALVQAAREGEGTAPPSAARVAFGRYFGPFMLGLVILFPLIALGLLGPGASLKWINNYGVQILIYVMLGWGLNIVVGLAGLLDLGYVAFYAVGAYSYALLSTTFDLSFWICLPLAGLLAAMWGIILGFPVLRLRGDYLAIVTLAFGEIIRMVLINWVDLTNGYAGISEIPHVSFFGIPFTDDDDGFAAIFHLPYTPIYRTIFFLSHPRARAPDQFRNNSAPPLADRAGLGGASRGRNRLQVARHQHHQHQAHRVRAGRHVRRLRRFFLRRAPGVRQSRELHLHRIRRPSSPSSCSAGWAPSSASPLRPR